MRVLQVAPRYAPRTGGVETHVRELATRLRDRGHTVRVVTADARSGEPRRERVDGVPVRRHRGLAPGGAFHVAPGVYRTVRRSDADVVHAHNYHSLPLAFAAAAAGDRAFVATPHYHGGSADPVRDRLLAAYRPIGRRALARADAVLAVGAWERDALRSAFGVDARVVPNGLDRGRFANATPDPAVADRDRPYLLCVGRLEAYKGVQYAVDALVALPEYDLIVAGRGPHRDALERRARERGVADRVSFAGYVPDDRLPGLYAGASAHLALSSFEAYGLTVGEALAAGVPCVVRDAAGLGDWADRPDCVGVADAAPAAVARAVREAVGRDAPAAPLPAWAETAADVESTYRELISARDVSEV